MIRLVTRLRDALRNIGRGYGGALILLQIGFLSTTAFILVILSEYRQVKPGIIFDSLFLSYVLAYWKLRVSLLLLVLFSILVAVAFQADRTVYYRFFRPTAYWRLDARTRRGRTILNGMLGVPVLFLFLALPPLLHLYYPVWIVAVAAVLPVPLAMTEHMILYWGDTVDVRTIKPVSRSRVPTKTWNTAALGVRTVLAQRDLDQYERLTETGPMSKQTLDYISRGAEGGLWRGNDAFIRLIAEVLGVGSETIELHDRTTDAIQKAVDETLLRVGNLSGPTRVLTTDNEYASVEKLLKDHAREGKIALDVVPVRELILKGASSVDVTAAILGQMNPGVEAVVMSHVTNDTGTVLDVPTIMAEADALRTGNPIVWIIDGAQAWGNVVIDPRILSRADYFATCGHKWLGGKPTLGVLMRKPHRGPTILLSANNRSFSRLGDPRPSGTVNIDAHVTLNAMLTEFKRIGFDAIASHNVELAGRLSDFLELEAGLRPVVSRPMSGIVCVRGELRRLEELHGRLKAHSVETTLFEEIQGLRFCCHYYHSEADVYGLVGRVVSLMRG